MGLVECAKTTRILPGCLHPPSVLLAPQCRRRWAANVRGLTRPVLSSSHHVGPSAANEMPFFPLFWGEIFAIPSEQTLPTSPAHPSPALAVAPLHVPAPSMLAGPATAQLGLGHLRLQAFFFSFFNSSLPHDQGKTRSDAP